MARCDEIGPLLGAFDDGELKPHEMQEVARHLAQCAACEQELSANVALGRQLRDTLSVPALEGFAEAVQRRIQQLTPPLYVRIRRRLEVSRERIVAGLSIAAAGLATAALTAVLLTPYADRFVARNSPQATGPTPVQIAESDLGNELTAGGENNSRAIISRLEANSPSVAVWSEPKTETTVIWIPDQP